MLCTTIDFVPLVNKKEIEAANVPRPRAQPVTICILGSFCLWRESVNVELRGNERTNTSMAMLSDDLFAVHHRPVRTTDEADFLELWPHA